MYRDRDIKIKNTQREKGKKDRERDKKISTDKEPGCKEHRQHRENLKKTQRERETDASVQVNQFILSFFNFF